MPVIVNEIRVVATGDEQTSDYTLVRSPHEGYVIIRTATGKPLTIQPREFLAAVELLEAHR